MYAAYAVASSCRPASMISNPPRSGRSAGDTWRHVAPPSFVIWTTPLLVAAQITPWLTGESEKVVIERNCDGPAATGRLDAAVRSGLISCHVAPASLVRIRNCVP